MIANIAIFSVAYVLIATFMTAWCRVSFPKWDQEGCIWYALFWPLALTLHAGVIGLAATLGGIFYVLDVLYVWAKEPAKIKPEFPKAKVVND